MGINADEYSLFGHFRVRIIEVAIREINKYSSIFVKEPEYRKTGRKVSSIAFHVSKAKQSKIALSGGSPQVMPVQDGIESIDVAPEIELLISQGISSDTAKKWLDKYGAERIKRSVEYTLEKQRLGFIKDSLTGYLARTISEDIALSWERENSEKRKKAETKLAAETKRKETEELAKVKKEAEILRSLEAFAILPVENKAEIFNEFAETLVPLLRKRWLAAVKSVDKPECDIRFRELFANFINNVE